MGIFNNKETQLQIEAKAKAAAQAADQQADSFLVKMGKSKWTWAIVAAIVVAAWLLGFIQG